MRPGGLQTQRIRKRQGLCLAIALQTRIDMVMAEGDICGLHLFMGTSDRDFTNLDMAAGSSMRVVTVPVRRLAPARPPSKTPALSQLVVFFVFLLCSATVRNSARLGGPI